MGITKDGTCILSAEEAKFGYLSQGCLSGEEARKLHVGLLQGIGDITSTEPGSAARYNSGKPPMELIPVGLIALSINGPLGIALAYLGSWQRRDGDDDDNLSSVVEHLIDKYGVKFCWEECARVFDYGRQKYAEWNWTKGMAWSVPMACIVRHALKIANGQELDDESGRHHVGHIMCNLVMLQHYSYNYPEGDDRPDALKIKED